MSEPTKHCSRCGAPGVPLVASVTLATTQESVSDVRMISISDLCAMCAVVITIVLGGGPHVVLGVNEAMKEAMVNASDMQLEEAAALLVEALDLVTTTETSTK